MENKEVIQEAIELLEKAIAEFWTDEGFTWNRVYTKDVLPLLDQTIALFKPCADKPESQDPGDAESEYMDNEQKRAFEAKNVRSVIR